MPTIKKKDGFRIVIYPNDHLPSHVHVIKSGSEVQVNLGSKEAEPSLVRIFGDISDKDVVRALDLVKEHQANLLAKWREIHG
jgi:Domain of unknown function (DUF4160)